ncbi:MAG: conditioned medium factor [Proteobacteria bacterium]|nr:conditioned medium factor [Pseudomonadota bacterium]
MKPSGLCIALAVSLAASGISAAAINPQYKQLAGPPSEFASMQPIAAGANAISSKSALLQVALSPDGRGGRAWSGSLPAESGHLHFMVFSGNGAALQVELRGPDGATRTLTRDSAGVATHAQFGIAGASYPADAYALDSLPAGSWNITLRSNDPKASGRGYLLLEGDPATRLMSYPSGSHQFVGQNVQIAAVLSHLNANGTNLLGNAAGKIVRADLRVTAPDGTVWVYPMADDGRHGDGVARDGTWGGQFPARQVGNYLAQVQVESVGPDGQRQIRTAEHIVPIVAQTLQMRSEQAVGLASAPGRVEISLPASETSGRGHYRAYAEVWGTGSGGKMVPVAWISGMTERSGNGFPLGLDQRWVARASAHAPFELRNVRIEDPDNFVTLAAASHMGLSLPPVPQSVATQAQAAPDEAMTMGPRPAAAPVHTMGTGSKLLLVHGYCSSLVWPASQFSNAAVFSDPNANRTNDQFALKILAFGNSWHDYGIVAHSQGGLASLHLYTYYWSGLDYVTSGSRLIQSVGSPYQGTNLAGVLASIGSWFGVGCGSNSSLTYSGASAWLAGIPTANRAKVNYYTTSFTTYWWRPSWCNAGAELVLDDPNDGVTEYAYDQLPGAVNRGHTYGQCHTTNMDYPAQYLDSSRNATMNANAAR